MDLLPTIASLAGAVIPSGKIIDGKDVWPLWLGAAGAKTPHEVFYYYMDEQLQAVRSGKWKLHLPLQKVYRKSKGRPMKLIDLSADPGETHDLSRDHPKVVQRLMDLAQKARSELGDLGQAGSGRRAAGYVNQPTPQVLSRF